MKLTVARRIKYIETSQGLPLPTSINAVQIKGASPPASGAEICAPRDAPLKRTLVEKSSEKNEACGAYMAAWPIAITPTTARLISSALFVLMSQKNGNAERAGKTVPKI